MGRNISWDGFITVIVCINAIINPYGDPLLTGFVGLLREEDILIKIYKIVCNNPLLQSEERKNVVRLQLLMYGKIHGTHIKIIISTIYLWSNTWYV